MPVCPPPDLARLNEFALNTRVLGAGRPDPACGEAICGVSVMGTWVAYVCTAPLNFIGNPPTVTIIGGADVVPPATLLFEGYLPTVRISPDPAVVPVATLTLTGNLPALSISSTVSPPTALLHYAIFVPSFAGQVWIFPLDCDDLDLVPAAEQDLVLVASACTDLALEPVEVR